MTSRQATAAPSASYGARLAALSWQGVAQLVRPASHSRRAAAAQAWARRTLMISVLAAAAIVTLMFMVDAVEITWMPTRGAAGLWPLRIVTDFGKSDYVITALSVLMIALLALAPRVIGVAHATLIGLATRIEYLVLAVSVPVVAGDVVKGLIGRGRPFVGGEANAFNFSHLTWTEAYASFPSGHATASCALAFAVGALWPRLRTAVTVYALVIVVTRLVLLAHHPSDVVGGALIGVTGAMVVRYWFAARHLAFVIRADGSIAPRAGPSLPATIDALRRAVTP